MKLKQNIFGLKLSFLESLECLNNQRKNPTPYVPSPKAGIFNPLFNVIAGTFAIFKRSIFFPKIKNKTKLLQKKFRRKCNEIAREIELLVTCDSDE